MQVKIDTKEKFTVITPELSSLSDNLAAELAAAVIPFLQQPIRNIVLNLASVNDIDENAATQIAELQQKFYDNNSSFVICDVKPSVEQKLDEFQLLDFLNVTPTESEAWDIVQMEEIERELMDNDEPLFNDHHDA
ncbi:STAS domain-containing protein [Deminuibacter soli]|uniref:STAS domain-containing protein n=1 Tax=Deminuibacter soli TaxID=2291815 RepID=A0A3E1NLR1_9BACT|nr:STAS domain-containing protein [Deminuibacter soli]RFM28831.1 STAS domain-containing protein [Deminuibacter soli]